MKTLNSTLTSIFLSSPSSYEQIEKNFKAIASDKELRKVLGCEDYLLYAILRGKDWTKCIAKVMPKDPSFPRILGYTPNALSGYNNLQVITYYPERIPKWAKGLVKPEELKTLIKHLKFSVVSEDNPYPTSWIESVTPKEEVLV